VRQDRIDRGEAEGLPHRSTPGFGGWRPKTRGCGWSLTCSTNRGLLGHGTVDAVSRYRCVDGRESGGMAPLSCLAPLSGRYLSFTDREEIVLLRARDRGVRKIARQLGRSPSTISRELRRNAATRGGLLEYRATTAQWHAGHTAVHLAPSSRMLGDVGHPQLVSSGLAGHLGS
jgi:hypothetical protein